MSLGVGLIGAGAAGHLHTIGYLSAGNRVRLVAVADNALERAQDARQRFGFEDATSDYHELLARPDVDVVSVCTPPASHAEVVLDAIRANKHILCEKPMTTTTGDARAIVLEASERPELCISCVFQHRDDPALQRARWLLERRALGKVLAVHLSAHVRRDSAYYANARGRMDTDGGGALMVQGIHLLDALVWLVGPIELVSGVMDTFVHAIETEDTIGGWARLVGGAIATVDCTTCAQRDAYTVDVVGEKAALRLGYRPGWARTWSLRLESRSKLSDWNTRWKTERRFPRESWFRPGDIVALAARRLLGSGDRIAPHLGHGPHVRRFVSAIENGGPPPVSPAEAAQSLEAVLAFYRSARQGESIHLFRDKP